MLQLATSPMDEAMLYTQDGDQLSLPSMWVIEFGLQIVSESHVPGAHRSVGIDIISATNRGTVLFFETDKMFLWSGYGVQGPTAIIDTDALHTYRVEVTGGIGIQVFQDNVLVLTGGTFSSANWSWANAPQLDWGDVSGNGESVANWSFFRHNAFVDLTTPTIEAPPAASFQCASEVPPANPGEATTFDCGAVSVTVSDTDNGGAGSTASPLIITRTFTATDGAGHSASAEQIITVVDTTSPSITAPAAVAMYRPRCPCPRQT
jgi:hypothetical protein